MRSAEGATRSEATPERTGRRFASRPVASRRPATGAEHRHHFDQTGYVAQPGPSRSQGAFEHVRSMVSREAGSKRAAAILCTRVAVPGYRAHRLPRCPGLLPAGGDRARVRLPNRAVIIAANHLSAADEVFTPVAARRQVAYFAKAEHFTGGGLRGRFVARVFREFGHIPVDRADPRAAADTIGTGVDLLAEGKALGIYPEGTSSPDGRLYRFRTGVARLALRSGGTGDPSWAGRQRRCPDRRGPTVAPSPNRGALRGAAGFLRTSRGRPSVTGVT